jgi:hypothetical protein
MEAEILQTAEKKAGHTWMCPENEGNCYTRYNVSRERLRNEPSYDPATATSAIDHASQGGNSVMGNALVSYRLNEDMHLGGDHVGLSLEIAIDQEQRETLRKIPAGPRRCRLEQEGEDTKSYQERSLEPLTRWLEGSRPIQFRARTRTKDRRRLTKEHLERRTIAFTETLHEIA